MSARSLCFNSALFFEQNINPTAINLFESNLELSSPIKSMAVLYGLPLGCYLLHQRYSAFETLKQVNEMVFKNKFLFSSKKSDSSSSPDGSNSSPRSFGSGSSIRTDKKKAKSSSSSSKEESPKQTQFAKDVTPKKKGLSLRGKYKATTVPQNQLNTPDKPGLNSKSKNAVEEAASVSPILASSLGLNRIKTRSGPLPQESFFGLRGDKGNCAAVVEGGNLSRLSGGDGGLGYGKSGSGSVGMKRSPIVLPPSRLHDGESCSEAGQNESSWGRSGVLKGSDVCTPETSYDCENPKESESSRFQAILRVTSSAPRKRFPGDIKSFSHELNSKGVRPFPFLWKPRGLNKLEEILVVIRGKFDKAKEEVNADLAIFTADLVGILEKNADSHPDWQETIEDLLVLARSCAMTSPGEFWLQCEGIVQELDDRRQELPPGMLKQLHTRMLFILTRCTRLLQFHKESGLGEDDHIFQLRQSRVLHSADKRIPPGKSYDAAKASKAASAWKSYSQEQHCLDWRGDHMASRSGNFVSLAADVTPDDLESPVGRDQMSSWKKLPSPGVKSTKEVALLNEQNDVKVEPLKTAATRKEVSDVDLTASKPSELPPTKDSHEHSSKHRYKVSWGYCGDQPIVSDGSSIICRISEEEVPTLHVEDHSRICAIAD
ncbi:hypothetical protein HS088_TW15G00068 [Tripterygium wilfordii]|uniref:IREH1/IRE-like N-terminal domain-containing protein n=1 Tax=Tripterygium wilfordii TaxID=458696 RepID=A0A7J7CKS7_TRIWF|nr:hypothetical protein HS088_TW15G00068 [Tripterygium wilfordii]